MIEKEIQDKYENVLKTFIDSLVAQDYYLKTVLNNDIVEKSFKPISKILKKKKVKKERNYDFIANNHKNRHAVIATNLTDNTTKEYRSLYACSKDLKINSGIVKMCCENKNNIKHGVSKKDSLKYSFVYA